MRVRSDGRAAPPSSGALPSLALRRTWPNWISIWPATANRRGWSCPEAMIGGDGDATHHRGVCGDAASEFQGRWLPE